MPLFGILCVVVYLVVVPDPVPPARLVLIGISSYPDRALPPNSGGREDVDVLKSQYQDESGSFEEVDVTDDALTRDALKRRLDDTFGKMNESTLVVYCSLHGRVWSGDGNAQSQFYVSNEVYPISTFLKNLEESSADHILLLIDAGRLKPNWRKGILANDFVAQFQQDVEKSELPKQLTVLCSAELGQVSWTLDPSREDQPSDADESGGKAGVEIQSVFGYYVAKGLEGDADGWPKGGKREKNDRVDSDEFYRYVSDKVSKWAREHRRAPQTVWRFSTQEGREPSTFDIVAVSHPKPKEPKSGEDAASDQGNQAPSSETGSEEADDAKPAVNNSGKAQAAPAELLKRLDALWSERDKRRQDEAVIGRAPSHWQSLQAHLLLAEQQLRSALWDEAEETMQLATKLIGEIDQRIKDSGSNDDDDGLSTLSLALAPVGGKGRLSVEAEKELNKLLDGKAPAENKDLTAFLEKNGEAAERGLARHLLTRANADASRSGLARLGPLLKRIAVNRRPAELAFLSELVNLASSVESADELDNGKWPKALCEQTLQRSQRVEQLLAESTLVLPYVRRELKLGLRKLVAAQRWLVKGGAESTQAEVWLKACERHFQAIDDVAQAVQLRDRLLVELPGYASWFAAQAEADHAQHNFFDDDERTDYYDGIRELGDTLRNFGDQLASDGAGITREQIENLSERHELAPQPSADDLLRLMLNTRRIDRLLKRLPTQSSTSELGRLQNLTEDTRKLYEDDFRPAVQRALSELKMQTPNDWQKIDEALQMPWIDAAERRRLRKELDKLPDFGDDRDQKNRSVVGIWQGFWAIQTLSLLEIDAPTRELWEDWKRLVSAISDRSVKPAQQQTLSIVHRRASLGRRISSALDEGERSERSTISHGLAVSDPFDEATIGKRNDLLDKKRKETLTGWLSLHAAEYWHRQRDFGTVFRSLADRSRPWRRETNETKPPPRLQISENTVRLQERATKLIVRLEPKPAPTSQPKLSLRAPRDVTIHFDGSKVTGPIEVSTGERPLQFELTSKPDIQPGRELIVALLDGGVATLREATAINEFPLDIRRLTLIPPPDPSAWRVHFLPATAGVKPEGRPEGRWEESALVLPAFSPDGQKTIELKAVLTRPSNDVAKEVTVTVYRKTEDQPTLIAGPQKFPLKRGQVETELTFSAGGKPDKKTDAQPNSGPSQLDVDLARGLLFKIEPEGRNAIEHAVEPKFWQAKQYIQTPVATFTDARISVHVNPWENSEPHPLLPDEVPVTLEYDKRLDDFKSKSELAAKISLNRPKKEPTELYLDLDKKRLNELEDGPFELSLTVGGLPHAFRWQIKKGEGEKEAERIPRLEIALPDYPAGMIPLKELEKPGKDRLIVRFEVNISRDEIRGGNCKLRYRLGSRNPPEPISLTSSWQKQVRLTGLKEGLWQIKTKAADYEAEIPLGGLSGRFTLAAQLVDQRESNLAEDRFEIAIDGSPPKVKLHVGKRNEITHTIGEPLRVTVEAVDEESGVQKVIIGTGAGANGKVKLDKPLISPPPHRERPVSINKSFVLSVSPPPKKGEIREFVAVATNGIGDEGTSELLTVTFKEPKGTPPGHTGGITVVLDKSRRNWTFTCRVLQGTDVKGETELSSDRSEFTFKDLPAGTYQVKVFYKDRRDIKSVTVTPGKTKTVTLKPSYFK